MFFLHPNEFLKNLTQEPIIGTFLFHKTQGLKTITSLNEVDEDHQSVAEVSHAGVPLTTPEEDASYEAEDSLKNNKAATTDVTDSVIAPVEKEATEPKSDETYTPDAFFSESGNILLDLITLQKLSVSEQPQKDN